jgi:hypothetical protein
MRRAVALFAGVFALSGAAVGTAHAGFYGDQVRADYEWPALGTILYPSGTAVAGPGVEFDDIGGFGVGSAPSVDFANTSITVDYPGGFTLSGTGTFDGWVFSDLTKSNIVSATLAASNLPGLVGSDVSFSSNQIDVNTLGLGSWGPGTTFTIDVGFVPEPAVWTMLILGVGFVGGELRGRRRRPRAAAN